MEKIELLKKIIDDQAILINKLQGYLVGGIIQTPKKIVKPSNKLTIEEATINLMKMFERSQERKKNKS
tara:strand:+ start:388 stop:591 length:204 start_codon:yes stop_codon:yes gene_type:complete